MQKDFHFYLTYAVARKCGIPAETAERIAWADQYTDDLTKADLHGIQTQCPPRMNGNWQDPQVQLTVLVPFHFLPGDDGWVVEPNSARARALVERAKNPIQLGIALHTLQDTFSHQGWTGFREKYNSCDGFWYPLENLLPNVGHTDMKATPDVVSRVWTDPRTGKVIDNKVRAESCAAETFRHLYEFAGRPKGVHWPAIADELEPTFHLKYDDRKRELRRIGGNHTISYKNLTFDKDEFIQAARQHLAAVMESLKR